MGMFDDVRHDAPCVNCGVAVRVWQSKDGPCEMAMLEPIDVRSFYAICDHCKHWNQKRVVVTAFQIEDVSDAPTPHPRPARGTA